MHHKYVKGFHLLVVCVDHPPVSWRCLAEIQKFAESRICWCLGDGLVDFWYDRWCTDTSLGEIAWSDGGPVHLGGGVV